MRYIFGLLIFLTILFNNQKLHALDVSIDHAIFQNDKGKYVELYFYYLSNSCEQIPVNSDATIWQSVLEVSVLFKKSDTIFNFDSFKLNSPKSDQVSNFSDLKRYQISELGQIEIQIEIVDVNDKENKLKKNIDLLLENAIPSLSGIQFIGSLDANLNDNIFQKQGFHIETLPFNFLNSQYDKLQFYIEVYGLTELNNGKRHFLEYKILDATKENNDSKIELRKYKVLEPENIKPLILSIPVTDLQSGKYRLVCELKDENKNLLYSLSKSFDRSNPTADFLTESQKNRNFEDSWVSKIKTEDLDFYLRAHRPIAPHHMTEVLNSVLISDNATSKRYYLFQHWVKESGEHPDLLFAKYMEVANAINNMYNSGFGYGFETDRGYIYLKYGRPDDVVTVEDEPSAPPYEIWVYNWLEETKQSKVKFLYYNPSLSHNAYRLLHSTCRGERYNLSWEVELYKQAVSEDNRNSVDANSVMDNFNRNAKRLFEDL